MKIFVALLSLMHLGASVPPPPLQDTAGLLIAADKKIQAEDYDGAIADLDRAIDLAPKNAYAYSLRGFAKHRKGRFQSALDDCNTALDLKPNLIGALLTRGDIRMRAKYDYDGAYDDFNEVIKIDPRSAAAYHGRGWAEFTRGNREKGLADFDTAIELDPMHLLAYWDRAISKVILGKDLEGAARDFSRVIQLVPENPVAYSSRGSIRLLIKQVDEAIADFARAIELDPKHTPGYLGRAHAYFQKRAWKESLKDFQECADLGKGVVDQAHLRMYLIRVQLHESESGLKILKVYADARAQGEFGPWFAKIYATISGQLDESTLLEELEASKDPEANTILCEMLLILGTRHAQSGNKEQARKYFKRCIAKGEPRLVSPIHAQQELDILEKSK